MGTILGPKYIPYTYMDPLGLISPKPHLTSPEAAIQTGADPQVGSKNN